MEEMNNVQPACNGPHIATRKNLRSLCNDGPDNVTLLVRYLEYKGMTR